MSASEPVGTAVISDCGKYRYTLTRKWNDKPTCVFVMLNPSTASADTDDNTIRRCVSYAKAWGYGSLTVVNLYAYRATDPKQLWIVDDPIGPANDAHIRSVIKMVKRVVVAWGANADKERARVVLDMIRELDHEALCLGKTKDGHPKHPLYLSAKLVPTLLERTEGG